MRVGRLLFCTAMGVPLVAALIVGGCGHGKEMAGAGPEAGMPQAEAPPPLPEAVPAPALEPETAAPARAPAPEAAPGVTTPSLPPAQSFDIFADTPAPAAPPPSAQPETYEVYVPDKNYAFVPQQLTIYVGDTVVWQNNSGVVHLFATIPGSDPSGRMEIEPEDLLVGARVPHTFERPGEYPYFCFIHNRMTGRIVVLERP